MSAAITYRALSIKASLGTRVAAGYLRNQGISLAQALLLLTRSH